MISTSKEYKVRAEVQIRLNKFNRGLTRKIADSICSAIFPEIKSVDCGQKIGICSSNNLIRILIYTNDQASVRAIFNSYMMFILTAYSCIRLSL
jgi:tRNA threonylcarbamoyladenosine modification (KEOPS) complex  Pcc1 subunit